MNLDERIGLINLKLQSIDVNLKEGLMSIRSQFPDDASYLLWLNSPEFGNYLNSIGLSEVMNEVDKAMLGLMQRYEFKYTAEDQALYNSEILRQINYDTILRSYSSNADYVKTVFANSILNGQSDKETRARLESVGLKDYQAGAVLQTTLYNFSRTNTVLAYKDEPEARFTYEGGLIPTSSDQCKWLMLNQKEGGYTMAEIMAGIETPYTNKQGQKLIINELGRLPNFNCIHEWEPIDGIE